MASSSTTTRRNVLLYGTSANPPAALQGHMGAVAYCRQFADEVWVLPVYQHIFSSKRQLAPFDQRVQMCELALKVLPAEGARVEVKQYERELFEHLAAQTQSPEELRIGTIDLVEFLLARHPNTSFTMLLGADTYIDLCAGKWKRGDELQRLIKFLVMDRKGIDAPWRQQQSQTQERQTDDAEQPRVRFITIPGLSDVSSTFVRGVRDVDALRELVGPDVAAFIVEHKLYAFASDA